MTSSKQNTFDFAPRGENQLHESFKQGGFTTLVEIPTPPRQVEFDTSAKLAAEIVQALEQERGFAAGLAIGDKTLSIDSHGAASFADAVVPKSMRNSSVLYISGRGAELGETADSVTESLASGFRNLIMVTGDGYSEHSRNRNEKSPCVDSIHTLTSLKCSDKASEVFPGAVVNPFKYNEMDLLPQYFKVVRKINCGASFLATQAGWDMMKLQEVRWFLNIRDLHVPTIARLMLLTPDLVKRVLSGDFPGVHISRDFKLILENEMRYGYHQFAAAQWRRLQLQAAGCRLMGYSGIQIYGIEVPEHVSTVRSKIEEALSEFNDFNEWKDAYIAHISRADMAPFSHRYYLYKNLFQERDAARSIVNPETIAAPSLLEKLRHGLRKAMFSKDDQLAPDEHRLFKKIFAGCARCDYCRLPLTQYVCPENCPKGVANGPCGGGAADGTCELRDTPCVYAERTRIAVWLNEMDSLEERYVKHPAEASKVKSV
ncbi:MAG: hypothetical protein GXP32_02340 [Kiritimatiellaeota bacterium]|nr:hypothetical protein [Kiritimatiellota bacterium]